MRPEQIIRTELHYVVSALMRYAATSEQTPAPFEKLSIHRFNCWIGIWETQSTGTNASEQNSGLVTALSSRFGQQNIDPI